MKEMTKRILTVVIIASLVSIAGFLFMVKSIADITAQYSDLVNEQVASRYTMSEIKNRIYSMHFLTTELVLKVDEEGITEYIDNLTQYKTEMELMFDDLNASFTEHEDKETVHIIYRSYNEFINQADIVIELCRKNRLEAAEYYVTEIMKEYLNETDRNLKVADEYMKNKIVSINLKMESNIADMNVKRNICIVSMILCIAICITITLQTGKQILHKQSEQIEEHQRKILDMQNKTIIGMANLIESRDGETGQHVKRTSAYVKMLAEHMREAGIYTEILTEEYIENLSKAAPMHDIGKLMIPDSILQKPGKLTEQEFDIIKNHTTEGGKAIYMALGEIEEKDYLQIAHDVAVYHHEKWNGQGYPAKLSGQTIPLEARIMAVADVFDALLSKRCYKNAIPFEEAYSIIEQSAGTHFDPEIVNVFLDMKDEVYAYLEHEAEEQFNG